MQVQIHRYAFVPQLTEDTHKLYPRHPWRFEQRSQEADADAGCLTAPFAVVRTLRAGPGLQFPTVEMVVCVAEPGVLDPEMIAEHVLRPLVRGHVAVRQRQDLPLASLERRPVGPWYPFVVVRIVGPEILPIHHPPDLGMVFLDVETDSRVLVGWHTGDQRHTLPLRQIPADDRPQPSFCDDCVQNVGTREKQPLFQPDAQPVQLQPAEQIQRIRNRSDRNLLVVHPGGSPHDELKTIEIRPETENLPYPVVRQALLPAHHHIDHPACKLRL